jgi:hypothetical protein
MDDFKLSTMTAELAKWESLESGSSSYRLPMDDFKLSTMTAELAKWESFRKR